MSTAIDYWILITSVVVGFSHLFQAQAWADLFDRLYRAGRPGALLNGTLSLFVGGAILAGHWEWKGPKTAITVFGILLVAKGAACLLAPERLLVSMDRRSQPGGFRVAGLLLLAFAGWVGYCLAT